MSATRAVILYLLTRLDARVGRRRRKPPARPEPLPESNVDWMALGYPARLRGAVRRIALLDGQPRRRQEVAAVLGCSAGDLDILVEAGLLRRAAR